MATARKTAKKKKTGANEMIVAFHAWIDMALDRAYEEVGDLTPTQRINLKKIFRREALDLAEGFNKALTK